MPARPAEPEPELRVAVPFHEEGKQAITQFGEILGIQRGTDQPVHAVLFGTGEIALRTQRRLLTLIPKVNRLTARAKPIVRAGLPVPVAPRPTSNTSQRIPYVTGVSASAVTITDLNATSPARYYRIGISLP